MDEDPFDGVGRRRCAQCRAPERGEVRRETAQKKAIAGMSPQYHSMAQMSPIHLLRKTRGQYLSLRRALSAQSINCLGFSFSERFLSRSALPW